MQDTNTNDLRNIIGTLSAKLYANDIVAEIYYRLKDPYSIVKKILRKTIALQELPDLVAFRIIVDKQEDCYKVLDIIYNIYSINIEKSKNYIDNPKNNGYRSLHVIAVVDIYGRNINNGSVVFKQQFYLDYIDSEWQGYLFQQSGLCRKSKLIG